MSRKITEDPVLRCLPKDLRKVLDAEFNLPIFLLAVDNQNDSNLTDN